MRVDLGPVSLVNKPKLGIALGSGAARGWVHLGLMQGLSRAGIDFDVVAGTSAGGVVGAFYAAKNLEGMESFAREWKSPRTTFSRLDFTFSGRGLVGGRHFVEFLSEYLPARRFEDLPIPMGVVASDLHDLGEVHSYEGALHPALRATGAVPGFLEPVSSGDMQLVDGGLLNPVPVSLARKLGAELVIGVDLNAHPANQQAESMGVLFNRTIEVMTNRIRLNNREAHPADLWIEPQLSDYGFFDFHRTDDAIELGRRLAERHVDEIRRLSSARVLTPEGASLGVPELTPPGFKDMFRRALNYVRLRDDDADATGPTTSALEPDSDTGAAPSNARSDEATRSE